MASSLAGSREMFCYICGVGVTSAFLDDNAFVAEQWRELTPLDRCILLEMARLELHAP